MRIATCLSISALSLGLLASAAGQGRPVSEGASLVFLGRASVKIKTASGFVIYIDPFAPGDYSEPADLILVTHGHSDHNQVRLVARKPATVIIAAPGSVAGKEAARAAKEGESLTTGPVTTRVMPASNKNHKRGSCFGYLVSFEGIVLYHAGDTNYLPEMDSWPALGIDYALLPCDGFYNMGPAEASRCAEAMKARRVIPIHSSADGLSDESNARAVKAAELIVLAPGARTSLSAR